MILMVEYRRALSKDEIPTAFRNVYGDRTKKPLSVQMGELATDVLTPIGTINDISTELEKEDPSYVKIAGLAGLELLGTAAPIIEMAAKSGNKGMIQKAIDAWKKNEAENPPIDPNSVEGIEKQLEEAILFEDEIKNLDELTSAEKAEIQMEKLGPSDDQLKEMADKLNFLYEGDLQKAYDKKIIDRKEYLDNKYVFYTKKQAEYKKNPPNVDDLDGIIDKEYVDNYLNLFNYFDKKDLLKVITEFPDDKGFLHIDYTKNILKPMANKANIPLNDFYETIEKLASEMGTKGQGLTTRPLARARYSGDKVPEKPFLPTDTRGEIDEYQLPKQQRESLRKGSNLGFKDVVYHSSENTKKNFAEEFDQFLTPDQKWLAEGNNSFDNLTVATLHDFLGTHVGTARAAAERSSRAVRNRGSFTMELKARLDKPATFDLLVKETGVDFRDIKPGEIVGESELRSILEKTVDNQYPNKIHSKEDRISAIRTFRRRLAEKGYTHVPYINDVEDPTSISYIMLTDRPADSAAVLRDMRAKFDPEKITSPDLRMAEGGISMRPEPRPDSVDVSPRAEAGDQFFVEQAERNKPFPNVKPKPRPDLDKNKGRTYDIYSVEIDGRETNVIEFKDGSRLSIPQIEQMFEGSKSATESTPGKQTTKEIINFLESNNPTREEFVKHFTTKRLNKGGAMMEEQMKMAFMDEGGLKDDGMEKDPVSGNEVPSGSMAKEVRDDIPAQLSEGEYVVPADVVRYYGVKFFEDLRERAKIGLQDMEMNGRIGGEPVPAGGPVNNEELSPEEMQAIQEMMGMAQGGAVNMYKQQQELYTAPNPAMGNPMQMNQGGQVSGYDQAGTVTANQPAPVPAPPVTSASVEQDMLQAGAAAQQSNFGGFGLGATIFPSEKTGKTILETMAEPTPQTVTLYSPNYLTDNQTITLTLPAQDALYQEKIAEGYTTQPPVAPAPSSGGGVDIRPPAPPPPEKIDYTTYKPDELLEAFDKNRKTRMALLALGAVNPVIALFGQGATRMQEKEILAAMKGKGMKIPEDEGGILDNITDFVSGLFGKDKEEVKTNVVQQSEPVVDRIKRLPPQTLEQFGKSTTREARDVKASKNIRDKRKGSGMGPSKVKSTVDSRSGKRIYTSKGTKSVRSETGASTSSAAKASAKKSLGKAGFTPGTYRGGRSEGGLMTKGKKK